MTKSETTTAVKRDASKSPPEKPSPKRSSPDKSNRKTLDYDVSTDEGAVSAPSSMDESVTDLHPTKKKTKKKPSVFLESSSSSSSSSDGQDDYSEDSDEDSEEGSTPTNGKDVDVYTFDDGQVQYGIHQGNPPPRHLSEEEDGNETDSYYSEDEKPQEVLETSNEDNYTPTMEPVAEEEEHISEDNQSDHNKEVVEETKTTPEDNTNETAQVLQQHHPDNVTGTSAPTISTPENSPAVGKVAIPAVTPNTTTVDSSSQDVTGVDENISSSKSNNKSLSMDEDVSPDDDDIPNDDDSEETRVQAQNTRSYHHDTNIPSDSDQEEESDINTINSDKTSRYQTRTEENVIVEPINVRYQMTVLVEEPELTEVMEQVDDNNKASKDADVLNWTRNRGILWEFLNYMFSTDNDSMLLQWSDNKSFKPLCRNGENENEVPKHHMIWQLYFDGLRYNLESGKMFVNIRIHTPNSMGYLEEKLYEYCNLRGRLFRRCVVQAEVAEAIGWLLYTSGYTDWEHLAQFLRRRTGFEWGLRLGLVTNDDSNMDYRYRVKAMFLYVDRKIDLAGINQATNIFAAKDILPDLLGIDDIYRFVPKQKRVSTPAAQESYTKYVNRQRSHQTNLRAYFCNIFEVSIDLPLRTRDGPSISIREMVLNIPVRSVNDSASGAKLFFALDFTSDSRKQYFEGRRGPGGPGHIFSFYDSYEEEALAMVQGLGRYIRAIYGKHVAKRAFTLQHFSGNEGWKWDHRTRTFTTPQATHMERNLLHDSNAALLLRMQREEDERRREIEEAVAAATAEAAAARYQQNRDADNQSVNPNEAVGVSQEPSQPPPTPPVRQLTRHEREAAAAAAVASASAPGVARAQQLTAPSESSVGNGKDSIVEEKKRHLAAMLHNRDDDSLNSTSMPVDGIIPNIQYNSTQTDNASTTSSLTNNTTATIPDGDKKMAAVPSQEDNSLASSKSSAGTFSSLLNDIDSVTTIGQDTLVGILKKNINITEKKAATKRYLQAHIKKIVGLQSEFMSSLDQEGAAHKEKIRKKALENAKISEGKSDEKDDDNTNNKGSDDPKVDDTTSEAQSKPPANDDRDKSNTTNKHTESASDSNNAGKTT